VLGIFVCAPRFPSDYTLTNSSPHPPWGNYFSSIFLLFHQISPLCSSDLPLPTASRHAPIQNSRERASPTWRPGPVGGTRSHSLPNDAPPRRPLEIDVDLGGHQWMGLANHGVTCGRCGPAGRLPPPWSCPNGSCLSLSFAMSRGAREIGKQGGEGNEPRV
jgi:hypothetical protein